MLLDNSWTMAQAVTCFFHIAEQDEWGHDGGTVDSRPVRLLTLEGFKTALKRFSCISSAVAVEASRSAFTVDSEDDVKLEAMKRLIGDRLQASPKSDDDKLLLNVILSEQVQMVRCFRSRHSRVVMICLWTLMRRVEAGFSFGRQCPYLRQILVHCPFRDCEAQYVSSLS